jgi:peptide deformylase
MIQPLVLYSSSHNILRTKTKESDIQTNRENLEKLIVDMKDTLQSVGGLGLASNQLGRNESICLVKLDENIVTMVNPSIVNRSGEKKISIEGCLSLPDITTKVERDETVTVKFINPDAEWSEQEIVVDFPNSVVVQHEIDHLNGILMIDGLTPLQRNLISTKLKRVSRGNAQINYVGMIWRDSQKSWSLVGPYHKLLEFYSYHSNGNLETNGEGNGVTIEGQTIDGEKEERGEGEENTSRQVQEH